MYFYFVFENKRTNKWVDENILEGTFWESSSCDNREIRSRKNVTYPGVRSQAVTQPATAVFLQCKWSLLFKTHFKIVG